MEKQITIIVPTYNMEKYLNKCLDSLLIPEIDQVEVIVVNDGSKDRSSEIAHDYERRFPNSFRVIDKENGNYGSCINVALPLATGRYVKILDADDYFDTQAFSQFVNLIKFIDDDAILMPYIRVNEVGNIIEKRDIDHLKSYENISLPAEKIFILDRGVYMHQITYKVDVFKRFNYTQTEGISYTDTEWSIIPLAYIESVRYLYLPLYIYLLGREGQTMDRNIMRRNITHFLKVLDSLIKGYSEFNGTSKGRDFFKKNIIVQHDIIYQRAFSYNNSLIMDYVRIYDNNLKNKCWEIYNQLEKVPFYHGLNFSLISELRKNHFSHLYKIPLAKKLTNRILQIFYK